MAVRYFTQHFLVLTLLYFALLLSFEHVNFLFLFLFQLANCVVGADVGCRDASRAS